ncbi:MAG: 30S ribosomal protein S8 [Gemmatimonadales bacterium]
MSMTDPVADMLARIRNAASAGQRRLELPSSRLKAELARILHDNHYIADFKVVEDGTRKNLRITLRYHNDRSVIREMKRMSSPGLRRYVKSREIPRIKNGLGIAIVSTPKGLMSDSQARAANLGGELLAVVW